MRLFCDTANVRPPDSVRFDQKEQDMSKNKLLSLFFLLLSAFALTSCASVSTMQTAAVVPEGEIRWAIASTGTGSDGDTLAMADPNFEASMRYGFAQDWDLGLKIDLLGAQFGIKYQPVAGEFDLGIGLELGYQWVRTNGLDDPSAHVLSAQLPILMEYHFNPYVGLAFGPKILGIYVPESDSRGDMWGYSGLYTGIMVGLPLRLTDGIWFQPEINVYANAYDERENSFSTVLWHAGVSVFFGGL